MSSLMACIAGMALDAIFGDPVWLYHPVRIIGNWISILEKWLRVFCKNDEKKERIAGCVLWFGVVIASVGIPWGLLYLAGKVSFWLQFALETFWCYQLLAGKCLKDESRKVYVQLVNHNLEGARHAVSMIVGRDTGNLSEAGVTKAAVETVAENTSDGVIAPLIFMLIGGAPLGFFYKAVNTMDSMVGYKNEKYLHFGRAAAKLDDVMNFLPARISALLMVGTAFISGKSYNGKQAWRIWRRDNRKHASPNSAQTESVCAGALGIQLAGDASYFGKVVKKPYIGDPTRAVEPEDIRRTNRLMNRTAWICEILCLGILIAVAV